MTYMLFDLILDLLVVQLLLSLFEFLFVFDHFHVCVVIVADYLHNLLLLFLLLHQVLLIALQRFLLGSHLVGVDVLLDSEVVLWLDVVTVEQALQLAGHGFPLRVRKGLRERRVGLWVHEFGVAEVLH